MEEFYHSISKAINIDKDREEYTDLYNFVKMSVINGLKENEIFKTLFADLMLSGSYADNLKVTKPDEFDLVVRLEFPFHDEVDLIEDHIYPGNVSINLTNVIYNAKSQGARKIKMYNFLKSVTTSNGYLLQNKFQSWFEGILTVYLNKIQSKLIYENDQIILHYKKQGPAHTIKVYSRKCDISIDFVPGFRFSKWQSITPKKHLINDREKWEAIPKPIIGESNNPSFRCSYSESEKRLLKDRNQFKNALRMMKKFRDTHPVLVNLKSYFIKTLFLWHNTEIEQTYWNNSNEDIMDVMFEKLESALEKREILFFWDENVNMLRLKASEFQIDNMYHQVRIARRTLSRRSNGEDLQNIKNLFLTRREQADLTPELEKEIETNFWANMVKEAASSVSSVSPWVLGAAVGAFVLYKAFSGRRNEQH